MQVLMQTLVLFGRSQISRSFDACTAKLRSFVANEGNESAIQGSEGNGHVRRKDDSSINMWAYGVEIRFSPSASKISTPYTHI
jgi:hypothetical protein